VFPRINVVIGKEQVHGGVLAQGWNTSLSVSATTDSSPSLLLPSAYESDFRERYRSESEKRNTVIMLLVRTKKEERGHDVHSMGKPIAEAVTCTWSDPWVARCRHDLEQLVFLPRRGQPWHTTERTGETQRARSTRANVAERDDHSSMRRNVLGLPADKQ